MRKGLLSILILIASFFFSDEGQARALSGDSKAKLVVEQNNDELIAVIINAHHYDLEQNLIRVAPASRCGQVLKSFGNGHWSTLSFSATICLSQAQRTSINPVAKSSYLSHIYPSHNFW